MLWICWLVRRLSRGQCREATWEFSLGSIIASYLPNSGRDWLHLIAVWPPRHFGAAKSDTSTCFMHKHINRVAPADRDTHTPSRPHTYTRAHTHTHLFEWWKCRLRRVEVAEMRWVGTAVAHGPLLRLDTLRYWSRHTHARPHTHTDLAQIRYKMAPLIELISIFGQKRYLHSPLIMRSRWPKVCELCPSL